MGVTEVLATSAGGLEIRIVQSEACLLHQK